MRLRAAISTTLLLTFCFIGSARFIGSAHAADRWFITSDGVRLHYIEDGRGPTLVFIPGWTMPAWIFGNQIADFSRRYHVVALDPRSQGDSEIASSGHEPYRRGQDIAELLGQLGPAPVVLVGWSLGVLDTLAFIHEYGDSHVAGLVLIDNSVGEDPAPTIERVPAAHRPLSNRPMTREAMMRNFVTGMFARPQPPEFIERLTETCLRTPAPIAAALLSYPVPRSFWKDAIYSTLRPVLYLVRPHFAAQAANLAAHHPGAEALVLSGVGHAMFVDEPQYFDQILQSFISRRIWR